MRSRIHYTRKRNQLYRFLRIAYARSLYEKLRRTKEEQRETGLRDPYIQFVRASTDTELIGISFSRSLYSREARPARRLILRSSQEYEPRRCVIFLKSCVIRLARPTACTLHIYSRRIVSQLGNAADWCRVSVSVGAFAVASLLFGVLGVLFLGENTSADRFLYRCCNL